MSSGCCSFPARRATPHPPTSPFTTGSCRAGRAAGHADVQGYSSLFRAVACTADVDATANTGTVGTGEPVYWLDGAKAADDYADFYDGSWDAEATFRNESGAAVAIGVGVFAGRVWTGCEDDGTEAVDSGTSRALGAEPSLTGWLNFPDLNGPLSANTENNVLLFPLYGLSPVLRVAEPPGVTVSKDTLGVVEGSSGTYTLVLDAEPTASVTVDVTGGGDVTVEPTSLTFTTTTWGTEQTVTVTATEDPDAVDDTQTITHAVATGGAPEYAGLGVNSVAVTVNDNDTAGVSVSRATLRVDEGSTGTYTVRLAFQPTASVTVNVTGGGDVTVEPTSLTFTTTTWGTEQTVTVTATEDPDAVDDTQTITHAVATGGAPEYAGLGVNSVAVTVNDNDTAGVSVSRSSLRIDEGSTGTYTVVLDAEPTASVTVEVSGGGDITVEPTSLTFTTATWDTEQTVTVTAAEDLDKVNDTQTITNAVATGSASEYAGLGVDSVAVTVDDNDAPAVTVSFGQAAYSVAEGDSVAVRVQLSTNPERTVSIPLTRTNQGGASSADYSGVPSSVRFQSGQTVRSFTFRAAEDLVEDEWESVRLGFGALPARVTAGATNEATVSITDVELVANRPPAVSATAEPTTVYPGENVLLRSMASDPDGDALTLAWTSDGGGIFTPGAGLLDTAWIAPATETAHTVNLTLTATDPDGLSASVTVSVLVEPFPQPNAATGLEAIVDDDNTIHLSWTIPGQPSGVTIESAEVQQRRGGDTRTPPSWDTVWTFPGPGTSATVAGLSANTEYVFRVRLTTTHGLYADSRQLKVRTLTQAPAPRHFSARWPTQTSITLVWSTVETAAEYKLEYRKDGESGWTRVSGDFDHLPSTSDHRDAFGVAAGLDCDTGYHFGVSARGNGQPRNDGKRYYSILFGAQATTSARTGECAQEERVTNLLVSIESSCATLTWTPPSGGRDRGYRVERYSYTTDETAGEKQRSNPETLVEEPNRVAARYQDCSAEYRTDGAEHVYIVSPLDDGGEALAVLDDQGEETGKLGSAYTSILPYGPSREPEGPRNVRLTHDTQSSRGLAWDAPRDPWLSTLKTARAGPGRQQVVSGPWVSGYRVERREYRRTEDGGWWLVPYLATETWTATMTVGHDSQEDGYGALGGVGALSGSTFLVEGETYTIRGLMYFPQQGELDVYLDRELTRAFDMDYGEQDLLSSGDANTISSGGHYVYIWSNVTDPGWAVGNQVPVGLAPSGSIGPASRDAWEILRQETDVNTGKSFNDATDKGDKQYVYRVWPYNDRGLSLHSFRGDWAFNGGDPAGYPQPAEYIPAPTVQQQGGETPSNTSATGAPTIGGTRQVGQTLTADTSGIADEDGLTKVSYGYQWLADDADSDGATGSSHTLANADQGKTIKVKVSFTDDADNEESLTSAATDAVAAKPNTAPTGLPTISGTAQVGQTLTADTSGIADADGLDDVSYSYQWLAGGTGIDGATGSSFTPTAIQQGKDHPGAGLLHRRRGEPGVADQRGHRRRGGPPQHSGHRGAHHQRHGPGRRDPQRVHLGHRRRGRAGQRFLQLPVAGRR